MWRGRPLNSKTPTCWAYLAQYPPIMVRLLARRASGSYAGRSFSLREIAITSNIPLWRVIEISQMFSWEEVTIGEAERFCRACRFDPTNARHLKNQREYLRICQKRKLSHAPLYLRSSPWWVTEFLPLIQRMKSHQTSSGESAPSASPASNSAA